VVVGASQQKKKFTPSNTCYNLSNQLLDSKFFLMELTIFDNSKIVQSNFYFGYPNDRNYPQHEEGIENHQ
jgi:hypothetical protein